MADDPLLDRVRAALAPRPFTEQKMFGGTCFLLNGNMVAAASPRGLLLRVGKEAYAAALRRPHARPMEMRGRPMEGYLYVAPAGTARDEDLGAWLALALGYVETLPAKAASAGRSRARRKGS
jgi:hypothetical protein